jgi:hypothetical protein
MDENNSRESKVDKSQEDTKDREDYDIEYTVSVIGEDDDLDFTDVDIIICLVRDPSEFVS